MCVMCVMLFCRDQHKQLQRDESWRKAVKDAGLIDIHAIALDKYHMDLANLFVQSLATTENLMYSENFLSTDLNESRELLSTFGVKHGRGPVSMT